ncbi:hypothetical protein [Photobacterium sp. GB-36]|uniref:hypothetical protein n=1 Tax=Photobacterium sp. GB-36 TaxID=2022108 RepID=UPI000D1559E9|nr:hypothetical protein [Photobacterium sp. GB-36]PSV41305.1 hypothetical protein C9J46_18610 [Photobacterium sp. GB-36]
MKSKELMQIFELSAKIMSFYKDKDVIYALNDIITMCESNYENVSSQHTEAKSVKKYNEDIISEIKKTKSIKKELTLHLLNEDNIKTMTIEDISIHLSNREFFPSIESLNQFAITLGMGKQSRVSRDNLIYSIIKFIERSRIDSDINSRNN